jgi:hypothetical protein
MIMVAPPVWTWGPLDKEKKRLAPLMGAIAYLKGHGLCSAGIIGAYHSRWVAPLMELALLMYGMAPVMWLEGITFTQGLHHDSKIQQRIWEALDEPDAVPGRGASSDAARHRLH